MEWCWGPIPPYHSVKATLNCHRATGLPKAQQVTALGSGGEGASLVKPASLQPLLCVPHLKQVA